MKFLPLKMTAVSLSCIETPVRNISINGVEGLTKLFFNIFFYSITTYVQKLIKVCLMLISIAFYFTAEVQRSIKVIMVNNLFFNLLSGSNIYQMNIFLKFFFYYSFLWHFPFCLRFLFYSLLFSLNNNWQVFSS